MRWGLLSWLDPVQNQFGASVGTRLWSGLTLLRTASGLRGSLSCGLRHDEAREMLVLEQPDASIDEWAGMVREMCLGGLAAIEKHLRALL